MRSIAAILSIFLFVGCNINRTSKVLADVESYISDRPDSALCVLESLDSDVLNTRRLRAHHALLHAMALDKNYIDVTDDSLANVAVNYYQKHGKKKYLARSLYYKALAHYYAKDYEVAIVDATRAENIARESDSLYLGFTKVLQADIYISNHNEVEELTCLEEAAMIYNNIGAAYYENVATFRLAQSCINNNFYDRAHELLTRLVSDSTVIKKIRLKAIRENAFLMTVSPEPDYESAVSGYEYVYSKDKSYLVNPHCWAFKYSLTQLGKIDRAKQLEKELNFYLSQDVASYWQYRIARISGDKESALKSLEQYLTLDNEEVKKVLKQSISVSQRDFFNSQSQLYEHKVKINRLIIVSIIISSILILVITALLILRYIHSQRQERESYLQYAEEITRQLREYKNNHSLRKKYIATYKSRYETIGALYDQYVHANGRVDAEKIIYRKVVSLIDELRLEIERSSELERMLNEDLDGIMDKLHAELPRLKKKDYLLFGFISLGFDATVISHFMDTTVNTVYIRKSRLKKQIEESSAEHKSQFLELMS